MFSYVSENIIACSADVAHLWEQDLCISRNLSILHHNSKMCVKSVVFFRLCVCVCVCVFYSCVYQGYYHKLKLRLELMVLSHFHKLKLNNLPEENVKLKPNKTYNNC